jgi:hypothetical protein
VTPCTSFCGLPIGYQGRCNLARLGACSDGILPDGQGVSHAADPTALVDQASLASPLPHRRLNFTVAVKTAEAEGIAGPHVDT